MSMTFAEYIEGASLPDLWVEWRDAGGRLIAFGTDAYAFTLVLEARKDPGAALVTKVSGFTGYDSRPNLRIGWTNGGDISTLSPGIYEGSITAVRVADGLPRKMPVTIQIKRSAGGVVDPGPPDPPD